MATTLTALLAAVRSRLRDETAATYKGSDAEYTASINAALEDVAGQVHLGEKWVTGGVTITAGSSTATLSASSYQYASILALRDSDGELLHKCTNDELEARYWDGYTDSTKSDADPTTYALLEDESNNVIIRFQAPVLTSGTLDICRAVLPADLVSGTDAAPLSRLVFNAVADLVAAEWVAKFRREELDQLRLDEKAGAFWLARAARLLRDEKIRLAEQQSVGRMLRYVS